VEAGVEAVVILQGRLVELREVFSVEGFGGIR